MSATLLCKIITRRKRELTASINNALEREQSLERQKSVAESQLSTERDELSRYRSELSSAEDSLSEARCKKKDANTGKVITGIAAGLLTVFFFGTAAPVTAPLAAGAIGGAIAFGEAEKNAEREVDRCRSMIRDSDRKIRQTQSKIDSLSSNIYRLRNEKSGYMAQRTRLQDEKGRMKHIIVFLQDAQF